ncbi:peptidase domain-containing ABC transporter [Clostridium folliculivorans]|uniref:Bacteriocin cleavage/export ABC transporter n=1 Tax=Clostridium folliculivorans TaxID=2886038 RepID=A0A9W6DCR7_9CLOT|nr:peptidase domain-containing ABC transporter [Clostridium folliculivorans]GKU27599.1 bacteriocin cleavage/export ABC transporter [Clostridium folliculivorans]GKU32500.1 bacteriocin cleavage/export ABC transporter [Clostridium folliculivorans]
MRFFKKYICIKQHDIKDCGAACLATISKQYGLKIPISKIREVAGTDMQGTSAYGVIKAAEALGFSAKGVKAGKPEDIFSEYPRPAIAHVIVDGYLLHYVVIHKATREEIIIADPAKGIVKMKPKEFFKMWTRVLILMVPAPSFEKGDETKGLFQRFWGLVKVQKNLLVNIFIASILVTLLGMIGSFYFKFLLDDILPNSLDNSLLVISLAMIGLAVFKIITEFFRTLLLIHLSQNIDIPLLLGYYNHVINLPMNFFGTRKVGEIVSRFNDANKIRDAISSATLTLMIDSIMAVVGGAILYKQNSTMFLICFIPIVLYLALVFIFKKPIEEVNRTTMEDNAKLTSYLVESLKGIETVKAFNGEGKVNLETEKRFIKLIKSVFKYGYVNNLQGSVKGTVKGIFSITILWVGAYLVIKGDITIGALISFNALLAYFIEPIERMINLQPTLQSAIVAADRLGEILDLESEKAKDEDKKINPSTLNGEIELKNVDFRYGTRQLVLKDITMRIRAGEKIALVGESGSGKTTISKLLMNFYTPEKGEIILNTYNIKDINREALRDRISYISQEAFFFSGTIKENLQFANADATYEEIIEVCKYAQIHDFINSLPTRYETMLEEDGSNLSGGQRQRLAIARALLRKPEILIMDEATSNLDSITEKAIEHTIEECTKDTTTIIIAHRLSTIMRCDTIYVMDKGEIVEYGSHDELIKSRGYYYNLWSKQLPESYEEAAATIGGDL